MIEPLRLELADLSERVRVDEMELDLAQLSRMAEVARAYGRSQIG